jgi:predicted acylesterase/phospholipase RssA
MLDLVFEGGGAKGLAYIGAIQALEEQPFALRRVVGSSAGAMIALLLSLGYDSAELGELLNAQGSSLLSSFFDIPREFDEEVVEQSLLWDAFRQVDIPLVPAGLEERIDRALFNKLCRSEPFRLLFSLVECGGLFQGTRVLDWLGDALLKKGFDKGITLSQLKQQTGIELTCIVSDTTWQRKLVLNANTSPGVPVVWAVRASMSIPFVWQCVCWDHSWGKYQGQAIDDHELVDGGIISNFALDLLMNDSELGPLLLDGFAFGFLLDEQLTVPGIKPAQPMIQLRTVDRLMRTIDTVTSASDNHAIALHSDRVCRLPCKGVSTLATNQSAKEIDLLVDAAKQATRAYLSRIPVDQFN